MSLLISETETKIHLKSCFFPSFLDSNVWQMCYLQRDTGCRSQMWFSLSRGSPKDGYLFKVTFPWPDKKITVLWFSGEKHWTHRISKLKWKLRAFKVGT